MLPKTEQTENSFVTQQNHTMYAIKTKFVLVNYFIAQNMTEKNKYAVIMFKG